MEWLPLLTGAIVGAIAGLLVQNIMFPGIQAWFKLRISRKVFRELNAAWAALERLHPRLILVQGGWDQQGSFPEEAVTMRLGAQPFLLRGDLAAEFREPHRRKWESAGSWDGEQIGIADFSMRRISDEPSDELAGRSHRVELRVHQYRFFDYLATHHLLVNGSAEEKAALRELSGSPTPNRPVSCFPTPCSVGISLFCEGGDVLVLTRRSEDHATGGHWGAGQIFNAVGENAQLRDFSAALDGALTATPHIVARRGLNEEMGLTEQEIRSCDIRIHSFAWATDQLDFKFFGLTIVDMPELAVRDRFDNAPDKKESKEITFEPVRTKEDCMSLLARIRDEPNDWTPEAVFSTIRSLLLLQKIRQRDSLDLFSANLEPPRRRRFSRSRQSAPDSNQDRTRAASGNEQTTR